MIKVARNSLQTIKKRFNIIKSDDNCTIVNVINKELKNNPNFFMPFGAIDKIILENKLDKYKFSFPKELVNVWIKFGGGEFWEIENILYPLQTDNEIIEDMLNYNNYANETGFNNEYHIFASNTVELVAFHKINHSIKVFRPKEENYRIEAQFDNIIEWFSNIFYEQYNYVAITKNSVNDKI